MHKSIEQLAAYDIPTSSYIAAVQHLNALPELTSDDYLKRINELIVGHNVLQFGTDKHEAFPRYAYLYFVQELIRASDSVDDIDTFAVYHEASKRAEVFIAENSYVFAKADDDAAPKLDAAGNIKPKKGKKKELAKEVYVAEIEGKELTRKAAISILMEKVGLSAGGASTYYANLKNGKM